MEKKTVFEAGQKFTHYGEILTAKSFFGETGIEYTSAAEAKANNAPDTIICVYNEEYAGGSTDVRYSFLIEEPKAEDYGYQAANSFDEESGWMIEGGEEAYFEAMKLWELSKIKD